jgi:hypothetical protein
MNARVRTHLLVAGLTVVCSSAASAQIVINEVVYDNAGTDTHCWLELKGPGGMSLDGLEVIGINGNGGTEYQPIPLDGQSIPADGYFVISQDGTTPNSDMIDPNVNYQNSPDNIQLRVVATGEILDALGYGAFGATDVFAGEGSPAPDQTNDISLARCPDGSDTDDNSVDFVLDPDPTPGTANDADCGGPGDPTPRTLCEIAEDAADGTPIHLNEYVIVTGVVISPSGIFSSSTNDIKITDGECCVTVFGGDLMTIEIGDEVEVVGTVAQFNGLTEVSNPLLEIRILSSGNPIPDPTVISTGEFAVNGEDYESCLIGFECVLITGGTWPAEGQNQNLTIDDGSGPATMRIDADTDIDGSPEPVNPFSVIGVGGQFDSSAPYDTGYQMFPRFLSDFTFDDPSCGPAPLGACCFTDGSCAILEEQACADAGGIWQGPDTVCDPNPCTPVPTIESSWGKIKSQYGTPTQR